MSFFTKLNKKLVENRFKRKGLNIIQGIPTDDIKEIISLKEQITKAVANENYALASDLKNQILAIENGNSSNNLSAF